MHPSQSHLNTEVHRSSHGHGLVAADWVEGWLWYSRTASGPWCDQVLSSQRSDARRSRCAWRWCRRCRAALGAFHCGEHQTLPAGSQQHQAPGPQLTELLHQDHLDKGHRSKTNKASIHDARNTNHFFYQHFHAAGENDKRKRNQLKFQEFQETLTKISLPGANKKHFNSQRTCLLVFFGNHSQRNLQFEPPSQKRKQPTLLVVVLHSDDLSPCGSGTCQNSTGIQGLDGERVNHTDVLPYCNPKQISHLEVFIRSD